MQNELFVVYAQEDAQWVREDFLPSLRTCGISIVEELDFAPGTNRIAETEEVIARASAVILVISRAFMASASMEFIQTLASSHGAEERKWNLVPLMLEDVPLPPRLRMAVALDASDEDGRRDAVVRLCMEYGQKGRRVSLQSGGSSRGNQDGSINERLISHAERLATVEQKTSTNDGRIAVLENKVSHTEGAISQILSSQGKKIKDTIEMTAGQIMISVIMFFILITIIIGVAYAFRG